MNSLTVTNALLAVIAILLAAIAVMTYDIADTPRELRYSEMTLEEKERHAITGIRPWK